MVRKRQTRSKTVAGVLGLLAFGLAVSAAVREAQAGIEPAEFGENETVLFSPALEWSVQYSDWSGNPFDIVADVTFTHSDSGEQRKTQMFHDGGDTWKFRFTGTRTGQWAFTTESSHGPLDGLNGSVQVHGNPDPGARGFIRLQGQKFVRQTGEGGTVGNKGQFSGGEVEGFISNIMKLNREKWVGEEGVKRDGWTPVQDTVGTAEKREAILDEVWRLGAQGLQLLPQRDMHDMSASANNPNIENLRAIEAAIIESHGRGMFIHLFMWGDEARSWHPPDGLNSDSDKRLNRYIAARLGPLPGWTVSLGFDLFEWTDKGGVEQWAAHLKQRLGWYHPVMARNEGSFSADLDVMATDHRIDSDFYEGTVEQFNIAEGKPIQYERRFAYMRDGVWTMANTRRAFWDFAMAGGASSIWGYYPEGSSADGAEGAEYPNPEQLRTHRTFWADRFLPDMVRANHLSDNSNTRVLRSGADRLVFYREEADSINLDLSKMNGSQPAVAVDTTKEYQEIDLGLVRPESQTLSLPHDSDWAVAVGAFAD